MAKFAGFLKRMKQFANNAGTKIVNGLIKGIGKVNDVYKAVKPYAKPIVDALLNFVPGGTAIGAVAELGFDKASSTIDNLENITNLPPNTILPLSPNDEFNKYNKNLRRIHIIISRYSNTK
jgi:hypothetical protein